MTVATMTSKGQITIPKEIRDALGLEAGAKVHFLRSGDREFRIRAKTGTIKGLGGMLAHDGPPLSVEEMDELIAEAAGSSTS